MDNRTLLKMLFAAFPRDPVSAETMLVYVTRLKDIPCAQLEQAVNHCIDNYPRLPSIAEVLAQVSGEGAQKFLPAPPKTFDQQDEERASRPVIPNAVETLKMLENVPDPFGPGYKPPPPVSREERLARLRATEDWGARYEH